MADRRLIDIAPFEKALENHIGLCMHNSDILAALAKCLVVDVVEVVHGQWETSDDPEFIAKDFSCSVCEELLCDFDTTALWPGENCYYYCPNCGAKMDGRRKHNG